MKSSTFILVALAAAAGTSVNSLPQPAFSNKNPSQRPATAALPTTHTYPPRPESSPNARTLGIMNPLHSSVFRPLRCSSAVSDIEKSIFDLEIHLLETRRDEPNDIKSIQNLEYLLLQQRHRLAGERARGGETAASPIPSPPSLVRSPNEVSRLGSTTSSNSDPFNFDYLLTGGASASDRMSLKGLDRRFEDMALKKNMPQADDASSDKAVVLIPKKHDIFVERNRVTNGIIDHSKRAEIEAVTSFFESLSMIKDVIKTSAQEEAQQWCYRMLSKFGDINAMEKFEQNKLACASSYLDSAKFEILELEAGSAKAALDVLTKKSETVSFSVPIISNLLRETKKRAETNKRKAELQTKMDNELGLIRIDVKSDNNCYFRSIARSSAEFMFREENHLQVREKVINHIMAVNADHRHPLHAKYIFLIRDVMLETVDNLVERLRKVGTVEGWGGMDISTFMADALGVDVHIFNMDDGNLYDLDVSTEIRHSPEYSSPVINVFFADQHYQALVGKDIF